MKNFSGKLAVITGGGTGMGRALARRLLAEGCDVAMCDVMADNLAAARALCEADAGQGRRVSAHLCDVADEDQVLRFRDEVAEAHQTERINLLFNNAGVGGGGSFIREDRQSWERTWNICWNGVYYCTRAFLPMLIASDEGHLVNTSSVNGFWATLGPQTAHTAYSAAKFAVKGFSEALVNDFRLHAPHVKVSVVMPGHIGTSIAINSRQILGGKRAEELDSDDLRALRTRLPALGDASVSDDEVRAAYAQMGERFRDSAPTTADQAAEVILDGVREERWRILIGRDAHLLDAMVRKDPETAYTEAFVEALRSHPDWGNGPAAARPS